MPAMHRRGTQPEPHSAHAVNHYHRLPARSPRQTTPEAPLVYPTTSGLPSPVIAGKPSWPPSSGENASYPAPAHESENDTVRWAHSSPAATPTGCSVVPQTVPLTVTSKTVRYKKHTHSEGAELTALLFRRKPAGQHLFLGHPHTPEAVVFSVKSSNPPSPAYFPVFDAGTH